MTVLRIEPLVQPPDADLTLPGSKSITNRALVAAALAEGTSTLTRVLRADDTDAMVRCLEQGGATIRLRGDVAEVSGTGGPLVVDGATLDAGRAGTVARFLLPVLAASPGRCQLDGASQLRARPMKPLIDAVGRLGAMVGGAHRLPVGIEGPARGGRVSVTGDVSSQFLSGLLLAGPLFAHGISVDLTTELVSAPYVDMTVAVMAAFGVEVSRTEGRYEVAPQRYKASAFLVEPDASAASYFLAAAAISGGRVRVRGLGRRSLQGDVGFADILGRMGAQVRWEEDAVEVVGTGSLEGVDVDLSQLSDTAPTLAVVAALATSPTAIRGIGFVRGKESDRIGAVVGELRRCGVDAEETADGLVIRPSEPHGAKVRTHDDHRIAMSFAVLGLRVPGIELDDAGCVSKTFPDFFESLDQLRGPGR